VPPIGMPPPPGNVPLFNPMAASGFIPPPPPGFGPPGVPGMMPMMGAQPAPPPGFMTGM
jgi:splicing factor 3B subunit 4